MKREGTRPGWERNPGCNISYVKLEIVDLKDAHRRFHPREREEKQASETLDKPAPVGR